MVQYSWLDNLTQLQHGQLIIIYYAISAAEINTIELSELNMAYSVDWTRPEDLGCPCLLKRPSQGLHYFCLTNTTTHQTHN